MTDRPEGHSPRLNSDFTPNADSDDPHQKSLRDLARTLEAQMYAQDVGGVILLASKQASSWIFGTPRWCGLQTQGPHFRIKLKSGTPEGRSNADSTVFLVASLRDLAGQVHSVFQSLFENINSKLEQQGSGIDHAPIGSPGHLGPLGKERGDDDSPMLFDQKTCSTALQLRNIGVQLDSRIPDEAWVSDRSVVKNFIDGDPNRIQVQIWEPFRWIDPDINREDDPPWIPVVLPGGPYPEGKPDAQG